MFAAYRTRRIFRRGGLTHESAIVIHRRKGGMLVPYLRARRRGNLPSKAHFRRLHFLYKRHGIACREPLW